MEQFIEKIHTLRAQLQAVEQERDSLKTALNAGQAVLTAQINENAKLKAALEVPIDMLLFCPKCGEQHVDAPDDLTLDWTNPPHKSHLCHECGHVWRPCDKPTNGAAEIKTSGAKDGSPIPGQLLTQKDLDEARSKSDRYDAIMHVVRDRGHDTAMSLIYQLESREIIAHEQLKSTQAELAEAKERVDDVLTENTRLSGEWQQCHDWNNKLVSEHYDLGGTIKQLESELADLRQKFARQAVTIEERQKSWQEMRSELVSLKKCADAGRGLSKLLLASEEREEKLEAELADTCQALHDEQCESEMQEARCKELESELAALKARLEGK